MKIKINYSGKTANLTNKSTVLFCDEKFKIKTLKKNISKKEFNNIEDLLKTRDIKKNY